MLHILILLLSSYVLPPASSSPAQASARKFTNRADGDTLLALKASLSNQQGFLAAWNTSTDYCQWSGVTCSLKHKHRVTVLNLSLEGLVGTITPSIGNLTFLRILDFSSNSLHDEIPSSIGRLSRLQLLNLSNNSLQGVVNTGLKNCTSLEAIDLGSNQLTGEIPVWFGGLLSLKTIILSENKLTGIIPPSLTNLSALQNIYFDINKLEGTIPEGLGRLGSLAYMDLPANRLSGTIPTTFFSLSSLIAIGVAHNELHGALPSDLGNHLPSLKFLGLTSNRLTGSIPASIANATKITDLEMSSNNFTGRLPPEIGILCPEFLLVQENQLTAATPKDWEFMTFLANCTRLRVLDLAHNMLGGVLPSSLTNLSAQVQVVYVAFNEITGTIPTGLSNLVGLTELRLDNNHFTGALPNSIGGLNLLRTLGFEHNLLTGFMPSSIGNLTRLLRLLAMDNMFEGPLPTSLGNLQDLIAADFSQNRLTDPLPKHVFNLSGLSYALVLSDNYFVGTLPPEVGNLTKLAILYLSHNNLSGTLPSTLSNCQSLVELRLDHNYFNSNIPSSISRMRGLSLLNLTRNTLSGIIPQDLGLMGGIEELYLAHNNLSGHIPESFEHMTSLYQLDLSFNILDGKVPLQGVFRNVTGFWFDGNSGLCGGIPDLHLPSCMPESMKHSMRKHNFIIAVATPVAGIILCLSLMLVFFTMRKKSKAGSTSTRRFQLIVDNYPRVSYAELVQGTNGFAIDNLIGRGRYGSVYKCGLLLKNIMTTVAVKVFDLQQTGSSKSFLDECEALNKIRHRNLISVITCCSSSDMNHKWLHPDVNGSQQLQGLTLIQRLNIAVDIADALDYLHNNCEPPIVHCDLKSSNILLDENLVACIGDFGLAKILSGSAEEQLINSKSSNGIRGTIGYVPPEYGEGGQVFQSGDAYSFGIVILELFTGIIPTHGMFRDGLTLQKHAKNAFSGMLVKIIDPVLLSTEEASASTLQGGSNTVEDISNTIFSIMKSALSCSKQAPAERMCMRDAAAEMHRIKDGHVKRRRN